MIYTCHATISADLSSEPSSLKNFLYAGCFWHYCQGNHVDSTNFNGTKLTSKIVLITILSINCMTKQMLLSII